MRIAVLQVAYTDEEPVQDRVERVTDLVRRQRGADLVVLPELWAHGGFTYREWSARAEPVDGPTIRAVAAAARDVGAVVHAGSIVERAPDGAAPHERGEQGRGLWNTSVVLGRDGDVLATYRKVHRFGFGQGEPSLLEAGTEVVRVALPLGRGRHDGEGADGGPPVAVAGLATCYDLRFPEMFRRLVDLGARMVLLPAAWPAARVEAWRLLGRARAIEDQVVVVQCNTAGTHAGVRMGGFSQVVDARGEVVAEAGPDGEETLVVDVDLAAVDAWRETFPVLADRRL
jgi:predicted amidohydrolase